MTKTELIDKVSSDAKLSKADAGKAEHERGSNPKYTIIANS